MDRLAHTFCAMEASRSFHTLQGSGNLWLAPLLRDVYAESTGTQTAPLDEFAHKKPLSALEVQTLADTTVTSLGCAPIFFEDDIDAMSFGGLEEEEHEDCYLEIANNPIQHILCADSSFGVVPISSFVELAV